MLLLNLGHKQLPFGLLEHPVHEFDHQTGKLPILRYQELYDSHAK